ncbi:MAG TPA: 50S ribosomal protein L21 [Micavibrio sp.]|nr:50S ribosomal protein L21 [Pseudomonadota bacterium]MEC8665561.1 50S ribosomal protein L21 [Pseudomonadota bacterium]HIF26667.1 50S ribosomal protein L21 [Micavibrio sp.]HIL27970.1 50S ribosomal protein L21 [Micavibrio sp.]|tara:strand:- start:225 stop:506 length:282 start_codon:yes stop_codon:yes gene_type:complete
MFAVIRTGGKQYKVAKDDKIRVEKIEAKEGDAVEIDVLYAEGGKGAKVTAKVVSHDRDPKVVIFKKKRRQNYRRKKGHKQPRTVLQITDIKAA